jgi:hypothetical protein
MKNFLRVLTDFIYPPICLNCREFCSTRFLCSECWLLCALPDPIERCRHCFEELDQRGDFCIQCRKAKLLPVVRAYVFDPASPAYCLGTEAIDAMAGFAYLQWIQLEWPLPTAIIPMPDSDSISIGSALAQLLHIPFIRALRFDCDYRQDRLEEEEILLLFDVSNPIEKLQKGAIALSEAFPKRIYLLSLLPYAGHSP